MNPLPIARLRATVLARLAPVVLAATCISPAHAGADPFVGEMMLFGGNFCPKDWMPADGSLLQIAQYEVLYALIGTIYGGDGVNNFRLPDLRGRAPLGQGTGPGLSTMVMGQTGGSEHVTLLSSNLPAHIHTLSASTQPATHAAPASDRIPAQAQNAGVYASAGGAPTVQLAQTSVAGGSQPFSVRNPYLAMTWCISVSGIFPSRN